MEQGRPLTNFRRVGFLLTGIVGTFAALITGMATLEPYIPAHRSYARELVDDAKVLSQKRIDDLAAETRRQIAPTKIGLYDIQIGIARARRSTINDQIIEAEIQAPKSESSQELSQRRQRIQRLKDELISVEEEIKTLRDMRERG